MERHFLFQVQEFHCGSRMDVLFPNAWFGRYQTFLCTGGIMGPVHILWCIWYAFLTGGLLSLAILILCGGFSQRIQYLVKYMKTYIRTGERKLITEMDCVGKYSFHGPVFMSVMLYAGVCIEKTNFCSL